MGVSRPFWSASLARSDVLLDRPPRVRGGFRITAPQHGQHGREEGEQGLVEERDGVRDDQIDPQASEYAILAEAKEAGAATLNYGAFLQTVVDFPVVAFVVFLLVRLVNRLRRKQEAAPAAPPVPAEEVVLLREIRDAVRARG